MKILIVNGHLHVGGVEKSLVSLLKSFDYSKNEVDLLLVEDLGEYRAEIPEQVRVIYYDLKPTYGSVVGVFRKAWKERQWQPIIEKLVLTVSNKMSKTFLRFLDLPKALRQEYDCAIAYRVGFPLDLIAYAIKAKKKMVWWHHGEFDYSDALAERWRKCFEKLDNIICVSDSSRRMLAVHYPDLAQKMRIAPNIILLEDIKRRAEVSHPYAAVHGKRILVSVGRFSSEKHMIDTVDAMNELRRRGHEELIWYLVGDGAEREPIERKIMEYGLEDCMYLAGNQSNPFPYIRYADLFVHPSWVESQGIAVLEAMVLEKPCVVVHSSGTDEFVRDGYNAMSADQSVESLADCIEKALNADWTQMFSNQRITVEQYGPKSVMPGIMQMLGE